MEDTVKKIEALKKNRNAIILAHNYQIADVQDVADFVGDSFELSRKATTVESDVIVFCGVHFMAESAKILNPARTVLLPERTAGCPMADMIDVEDLLEWKQRYPKAAVVCYVNSSAAVKAASDICCTSANALKVVESLEADQILFIPDKNLADFVAKQTKKEIIAYPGFCPTHQLVKPQDVIAAREAHPEAKVIVHPECRPEVIEIADIALSTSQMLRYIKESEASVFLIGTEAGLLHRMRLENPDKTFFTISRALLCPNMKKTSLQSIVNALENNEYEITVPEETSFRARQALSKMLKVV